MLERRPWVPAPCEDLVQSIAADTAQRDSEATFHEIARLVGENRRIHDLHGINLNPASNVSTCQAGHDSGSARCRAFGPVGVPSTLCLMKSIPTPVRLRPLRPSVSSTIWMPSTCRQCSR